jgi:hypothetical protein
MFYIINSAGRVLFRSNNRSRMEAKAQLINTRSFSHSQVTVTDIKPSAPASTKYYTLLSFNDPIEC